jgi:hypothetical protein
MPHLRYHMLQGVGVFSLSVFFIGNVKSCNNGRSYQKSFHQRSFGVESRSRIQSMPRENVPPCEIAAPEDLMSRRLETTPARALQFTMKPKCPYCKGLGWVCENHPHMAWSDELGCHCGTGMLCECTRAESQEPDINRAIVEPSKIQKAH